MKSAQKVVAYCCLLVVALADAPARNITHAARGIEPRAYLPLATAPIVTHSSCEGDRPQFLPTSLEYTNPYSETILLAEICNPLHDTVAQVKYAIDALDAGGNVIETIIATDNRRYGAGIMLCVNRYAPVLPKGLTSWRYRVISWYRLPLYMQVVPISVLESSYDPERYSITGRVRNDSQSEVAAIAVSVSIHNQQGTILGCIEQASVNSSRLEPEQITSFRANFPNYGDVTAALYAQYDHHRVVATNW